MIDRRGEPIRGCLDPLLGLDINGCSRLLALAAPPLQSLLDKVTHASSWREPVPLLLGLPEVRPGWTSADIQHFTQALVGRQHARSTLQVSVAGLGHASALQAIFKASQRIAQGAADLYLIGGVDSYFELQTLDWLDRNRQLAGEGSRAGFFPGEAASFVALASATALRTLQLPPLAVIGGAYSSQEDRLIKTDTDCIGRGLSAAIAGAVAGIDAVDEKIDGVYCDINGERYRSEEWGFALLRTQQMFRDGTRYIAPANCWGDVGAASGALLCTLTVRAWERGYSQGPRALAWAGSEGGLRSAVLLQQGDSPRGNQCLR